MQSGSVPSDIGAGQRGKLIEKAMMLFHLAFPDHDGEGNGSWRGFPVLTPSKYTRPVSTVPSREHGHALIETKSSFKVDDGIKGEFIRNLESTKLSQNRFQVESMLKRCKLSLGFRFPKLPKP